MNESRIVVKRIYDAISDDDGFRVLDDRLWPRGVKKEDAQIQLWAKEIAPTTELRTWFHHKAERFAEFTARYTGQLSAHEETLRDILDEAGDQQITLLFAARERRFNHAVVLQQHLLKLAVE